MGSKIGERHLHLGDGSAGPVDTCRPPAQTRHRHSANTSTETATGRKTAAVKSLCRRQETAPQAHEVLAAQPERIGDGMKFLAP
jgi:hypothetical protein